MENGERPMDSAMEGSAVLRMVELNICMKKAAAVIMGSPVNMSRDVSMDYPLFLPLPEKSERSSAVATLLRESTYRRAFGYAPGAIFSPRAAGALLPLPLAEETSSARMVSA